MEENMILEENNQQTSTYVKKIELSEEEKKKKGISISSIVGRVSIYVILVLFALWTMFPIIIGFLLSFTPNSHFVDGVSILFPRKLDFSNYIMLFKTSPMENPTAHPYKIFGDTNLPQIPVAFVWTCVLVLPPTIIGLFTSAMSAFAFAKLNFKGKNLMFGSLLGSMMIPGVIGLAASFAIYREILGDGIWQAFPLFVPGMLGSAGCVFFLRQYFSGIPTDLMEAAKLDGMGYYAMFFKIIVPLSTAALIAQGILGFVGGYNDYFGPLLYLAGEADFRTVQLVLRNALGLADDNPTILLSAAMIALLPTLIIYMVAQRFFVEGIATSGMKL